MGAIGIRSHLVEEARRELHKQAKVPSVSYIEGFTDCLWLANQVRMEHGKRYHLPSPEEVIGIPSEWQDVEPDRVPDILSEHPRMKRRSGTPQHLDILALRNFAGRSAGIGTVIVMGDKVYGAVMTLTESNLISLKHLDKFIESAWECLDE